jgi:hypothetical protein
MFLQSYEKYEYYRRFAKAETKFTGFYLKRFKEVPTDADKEIDVRWDENR